MEAKSKGSKAYIKNNKFNVKNKEYTAEQLLGNEGDFDELMQEFGEEAHVSDGQSGVHPITRTSTERTSMVWIEWIPNSEEEVEVTSNSSSLSNKKASS